MSLNLLPNTRGKGQHGEQIVSRELDAAIAGPLDLEQAIDGNKDSLVVWTQHLEESCATVTPAELAELLKNNYKHVAVIHVHITQARASALPRPAEAPKGA